MEKYARYVPLWAKLSVHERPKVTAKSTGDRRRERHEENRLNLTSISILLMLLKESQSDNRGIHSSNLTSKRQSCCFVTLVKVFYVCQGSGWRRPCCWSWASLTPKLLQSRSWCWPWVSLASPSQVKRVLTVQQ